MTHLQLYLLVPLAPLAGAIVAGLGGRRIGRSGAHWVTIIGVAISFAASCLIFVDVLDGAVFNGPVYTWLVSDGTPFEIGFLIDRLSALMMVVVTFVSLMVHVYTVGYMADDPGYRRFFAYIALFTFSMLMLVMANNFLQLFFGWEAVGLVSYLLIGFWYTRPSAIYASLKAFLVNRVGDFGFLLAVALVLAYFGTLDYAAVFSRAPSMAGATIEVIPGAPWLLLSAICIGLFIGAMGKSAQFPLHVWLPDSMEGPTPISALIHAATMVTAGIFMVARMSPLFELSETALSFVTIIGATTALFMAVLGVVQTDIKRVIAYSTLSQLGYMTVALGVSAYPAAIFHLMTHAFFKALLFLAAGSVIIALHHEQDMRRMGGLAKYMPVTAATCWIGALALVGTPFFSGFYSKDAIIEAVGESHRWGATYAYWCVLCGVFVTALYTFRMLFLTFHGPERFRDAAHTDEAHTDAGRMLGPDEPTQVLDDGQAPGGDHSDHGHGATPRESPAVVTMPLVALAIPSILIGALTVGPVLFGHYFTGSILVLDRNDVLGAIGAEFGGPVLFALQGLLAPPFWLAAAGAVTAWAFFLRRPAWADLATRKAHWLYRVLTEKYYFDWFNERILAALARLIGVGLWKGGDEALIDGALVNGSAATVGWLGSVMRRVQSGYLYSYAFWMMIGLALLLGWFLAHARF